MKARRQPEQPTQIDLDVLYYLDGLEISASQEECRHEVCYPKGDHCADLKVIVRGAQLPNILGRFWEETGIHLFCVVCLFLSVTISISNRVVKTRCRQDSMVFWPYNNRHKHSPQRSTPDSSSKMGMSPVLLQI